MKFSIKSQKLANGLRVVRVPMPTDSITVMCLVGAGSRWETPKTNGLSHFLEHMVFKGTKKYPDFYAISSAIDAVGAQFNAYTSKEQTVFYVKSAVKHVELALDMVSQLVFQSLIPADELEKERGTIIEEINMYNDSPMANIARIFDTLVYGNTPLGWQVIGKKKNIRSLSKKDFNAYLDKLYYPQNMVLVLAGGERLNGRLLKLVKKYFNQSKKPSQFKKEQLTKFPQTKSVNLIKKTTEQAHLCLGVKTYPRTHKDRYVLAVLATLLGGGMSSRLFTEVREKRGLAYYIKTKKESFWETGYLVTQAGTDLRKTSEAVKIIKSEYEKIAGQKVKTPELKKAKEYLKGHFILGLEDSQEVANMMGDSLLLEGKVRRPRQVIKAVEAVTPADIQRVARDIFQNPLKLAVIGPYKSKAKFAKLLSKI